MTFGAAVLSVVFGVSRATIISLLTIIAIEQFWNSIFYFEKITSILGTLKLFSGKDDVKFLKNKADFIIENEAKKAKHSIFISGSTLCTLFECRSDFIDLPETVNLEIVYTDFLNDELLKAFRFMVGYDLAEEDLRKQIDLGNKFCELLLRGRPKTIIRKVEYIMPIVYVGIDRYEAEPTTCIRAKHYLNNSNADKERFIIVAQHGSEYFNTYKQQIESILCSSIPI